MKPLLLLLMVFACSHTFSQITDGQKVLTTTLSYLNGNLEKDESIPQGIPSSTSKISSFILGPEITYGKIKHNALFSYGISLRWGVQKIKNIDNQGTVGTNRQNFFGLGPVLSYEKFIQVSKNVYYTPFSRLAASYMKGKSWSTFNGTTGATNYLKQWSGSFDFYPFSLTFMKNAKTNFLFRAGNISLTYDHVKTYTVPALSNTNISSSVSLLAQLSTVTIGIQKIL